ncbi:TrlF family AAA-like ATPase [Deinococcus humi]|uniref:ABC-type cobalamin/Fe3+-siderophores transport system ATPase subunit n=1 Tax=Deinococcus humi TaxID=662880 RepID=A0A7W8K0L7_9DEIO|nr:AAA family ATPase [Deinococcus humi]MBB5366308.1 ABC-type cobalamin/Fe3+-siderophores transport system ATPase subunit [Deinococcus humi]GGO33580.1 DNA repair ATPase [Deinococcus humi]
MKSEWLRWDLHVHSPESFEHQFSFNDPQEAESYGNDIFAKYLDVLEERIEVECVGITDYFSIDGYRKVYEARKAGRLQNFKLVLPNIEFRLTNILEIGPDRKPKKINFHVIFSDEIDPDTIENEFLSSLNFLDDRNSKHSLRRDNLTKFGLKMQGIQKEFKQKTPYAAGCICASIDLNDIVTLLREKDSIFQGRYLLVLAAENVSKITWGSQGDVTRRQLMSHADAIFTGSSSDRDFLLGKKGENFQTEFGKIWPVLHGSDAHDFVSLFNPDLNRYCWIKAQPTFEGLKQIIYEPEDRVCISEEQPRFAQYSFAIDKFSISQSNLGENISIKKTDLDLSRGLVAVIGGKGTGKTALLDLLAHSFNSRLASELPEGERLSSFVARNTKGKSIPDLTTAIEFADQSKFSKNMRDNNTHRASITYLSQGKIDEFSNDSNKLQIQIRRIIFDKIRYTNRDLTDEYESIQSEINSTVKTINDTFADLKSIYFELAQSDLKFIDNSMIDKAASIRSIELEIQDLLQRTEESKGIYDEILKRQNVFSNLIQKYRSIRSNLNSLKKKLQSSIGIVRDTESLNNNLSELGIGSGIAILNIDEVNKNIIDIDVYIMELIHRNEEDLRSVQQEVEAMSVDKDKIESLQQRKGIELISLQDLKVQRESYIANIESTDEKRIYQYENIARLLNLQQNLRDCYSRIISAYAENLPEILRNIEFSAEVQIEFDKWAEDIDGLFDSRKGVTLENIQSNLELMKAEYINPSVVNIQNIYQNIIDNAKSLKKGRSIQDIEAKLYELPIGISTGISYSGIDMDSLSMGQRGTVLLSIYLADGDNTLVIDQPEENLDNKYIYNVLVEAIKRAKLNRQIIIATHNANLVINTDAEQIVIADFKNNEIFYQSGTIEDSIIRKEIALILEGGEEAFNKREVRYSAK